MIEGTANWQFDWLTPQPTFDSDLLKQIGFLPGLKEFLMLRQVHALEHATVWVLSEMAYRQPMLDNETLGGLSTDNGFYIYGQFNPLHLQEAVSRAHQRLKQGEWYLAIHPRCGTNISVSWLLTGSLLLAVHLIFPRGPLEQLMGLGIAGAMAVQLSPDLGISAQKYLTTAIPFNLEIVKISPKQDLWGHSGYFVGVRWCDLQ